MGYCMIFSMRKKIILFLFLISLNVLLRFQVVSHEIGYDSFLIHVMANSLSEFGSAKWLLHPLSLIGYYPLSEASSVQFLISGIFQTSKMEMDPVIFIYCVLIGIISGFNAYLFAGALVRDDLFKYLTAFGLSTSAGMLDLTTWTMGMRGLLVLMAPLMGYLLLKSRTSIKYVALTLVLSIFLFATHRMFAYLIPIYASFILTLMLFKLKFYFHNFKVPMDFVPFITIAGFFAMFSIPFFYGKFTEMSRYAPFYESYVRYLGIFVLFAISGAVYLIFKREKTFEEWFIVLSLMFLTAFIYQQTYFKHFIQIIAIPVACIGLINITKLVNKRKMISYLLIIFVIVSVSFVGYYQFLHDYRYIRCIEDTSYHTGTWMKVHTDGIGISNNWILGVRLLSVSESTRLITPFSTINNIYGFVDLNSLEFVIYPVTSEEFWYNAGEIKNDPGESLWYNALMNTGSTKYNISYVVEDAKAHGVVLWHHSNKPPSKLLQFAYDEGNSIYTNGKILIWDI